MQYDELGKRVVTFGVNSIITKGLPIDHLFVADTGAPFARPQRLKTSIFSGWDLTGLLAQGC